jgi:hypothetical protein
MGNIVLRFANFDESLIDESNTTLELENLCTKRHLLLENWPLDFMGEGLIDARCNFHCIITYDKLAPILEEYVILASLLDKYVIHDHIAMFHV